MRCREANDAIIVMSALCLENKDRVEMRRSENSFVKLIRRPSISTDVWLHAQQFPSIPFTTLHC